MKIIKKNETNINLEHKTIGGIIDYYIIIDESPEEVLKDIQFLLGIPTLPPFWSLGNHQCRYGYKDFEEFKKVYEEYKKCQIPIDTMWIDIDAMDNYEIFTLNNKFKQLGPYVNDEIHKDGGKFVPIVDLGLSCDNKNSSLVQLGNSLDIFIKSNYTKKPLISRVWPEKTLFPDFMNPKTSEFWNKGLTSLQNLVNFDGIWLDMNEPATILKNEKCLTEIADEKDCTKDKNMYNIDNLSYLPGYNGKENEYILAKRSISENALVNENLTVYDTRPLISYFEGKTRYENEITLVNNINFGIQSENKILSKEENEEDKDEKEADEQQMEEIEDIDIDDINKNKKINKANEMEQITEENIENDNIQEDNGEEEGEEGEGEAEGEAEVEGEEMNKNEENEDDNNEKMGEEENINEDNGEYRNEEEMINDEYNEYNDDAEIKEGDEEGEGEAEAEGVEIEENIDGNYAAEEEEIIENNNDEYNEEDNGE